MAAPESIEYKGYKIRSQRTTVKGHEYTRHVVDFGADTRGKRVRRTFTTPAKAKAAIREHLDRSKADTAAQAILSKKIGEKADKLTTDDLLDAARGLDILKGRGSLAAAADFFIKHTTPPGGDKRTVKELVDEYAESRVKANRSPYTVKDIRDCLNPFADAFGKTNVAEIATPEIERWYDEQNGGAARKTKRRNHLVSMFKFAIKRKYRRDNPASALEIPTKTKSKPHVLTVEDVEALMQYAAKSEAEMVPYMALCLFAGIRPVGEMQRLDWKDIDFKRTEIFISDEVSKTGDERYVEMTDALVAWLAPYRQNEGAIYYARTAFERIRKGAGVRWAKDCMRHSFGSYHLAMWENMGRTMEQMGHTNARILKNHYRRAVRREDAERFWKITPAAAKDGVLLFAKVS